MDRLYAPSAGVLALVFLAVAVACVWRASAAVDDVGRYGLIGIAVIGLVASGVMARFWWQLRATRSCNP